MPIPIHANISSNVIRLGADPEMFVMRGKAPVPAFTFLPDKDAPDKPKIFWDGFQAEWTTESSNCIGLVANNTQERILQLMKKVPKGCHISMKNVVRIPDEWLKKAHDPHVALGCKPSKNVYGMEGIHVEDPRTLKYRVAGGHMHFSQQKWKELSNVSKYVKALDKILGIWAVGAAHNMDVPLRRQYYGLAGEYRHTRYPAGHVHIYGFEYRTLSNFYLCHAAIYMLAWEIARDTISLVDNGFSNMWASDEQEVVRVINSCDVKAAGLILRRNEAMFKFLFSGHMWTPEMTQMAFDIGLNGVDSVCKPDAILRNWKPYGMGYTKISFRSFVHGKSDAR